MDIETAKKLALGYITKGEKFPEDDYPNILDQKTISFPRGWIFYYNGSKFLETRDDFFSYIGNVPILVDKFDENVEPIWSFDKNMDALIESYCTSKSLADNDL